VKMEEKRKENSSMCINMHAAACVNRCINMHAAVCVNRSQDPYFIKKFCKHWTITAFIPERNIHI